jgi:branched-chain amino acid transport system permease protein
VTDVRQDRPLTAWQRLSDNEHVRRGAYLVPLALMAVVVTASENAGTQSDPLAFVKQAIAPLRLLVGVLVGVAATAVVGLLQKGGHRIASPLDAIRTPIRATTALKPVRLALLVVALVALLVVPPQLQPAYQTNLVNNVMVYALLALGLNVVVGYAGLLDLGYIAFFAIGAYSAAYWSGRLPIQPPVELNLFLALPLAVAAAMLAGVLLGAPTLRLRGDYLAIVTLGFGEIVRITAVNADTITNGPPGVIGIPKFRFFGYEFPRTPLPYYYLALGIIAVVFLAFRRLNESRVGRAWAAIREDEVAAAASGVRTVYFKLLAFAIGASTAGLAGVFSASKVSFVSPANFLLLFSILVLVYVILGGMGSLVGVIIGAALGEFLPFYLRAKVAPEDRFIYFGALLVVMMVFRPQGMIPSRRRQRELQTHTGADALGGAGTGDLGGAGVTV